MRLALWADDTAPTAEAGTALREATLGLPQLGVMQADRSDANTAAYSPDGRRIVTGGTDGVARRVGRRDAARGRAPRRGARRAARGPLRARTATGIALGFEDGTVVVTDAVARRAADVLSEPAGASRAWRSRPTAAVAAGARRRDGAGAHRRRQRGRASRWPATRAPCSGSTSTRTGAASSAPARTGASGSGTRRRRQRAGLLHGARPANDVALQPRRSPHRRRRATTAGSGSGTRATASEPPIRRWRTRSCRRPRSAADGRRFAAGGRDGVTRVWSVDGGPPRRRAAWPALARVRRRLRAGERSCRERGRRRHRPDLGCGTDAVLDGAEP